MGNWLDFKGNQEDWDQIAIDFGGNYRQLFLWGELQFKKGWRVRRYIKKQDKIIISSVQILCKSFLFFKFFYIPGGVSGNQNGYDDVKDIIKRLAGLSIFYVKLDSNYEYSQKAIDIFKADKWHRPLYFLNSAKTLYVEIKETQKSVIGANSRNWKKNLKNFNKSDAIIFAGNKLSSRDIKTASSEMQKFKNIYLRDDPINISEIMRIFGQDILVVYCMDSMRNLIGFRSALIVGDRAWEFYAATTKEGRSISAGFALLDSLIVECRNRGVARFILPLSRTNHGDTAFKKGTGAELNDLIGEWEYSNTIFFRIFVNLLLYLMFNSSLVAYLKRFFLK